MTDDLFTVTHAELMADVVGIKQTGVPCGIVNQRIEPGFVLENGTVLLESEKDKDGRYIGGAGMDGIYLRTSERYIPLPGPDGKICAFSRVDKGSVLEQLKMRSIQGKSAPKSNKIREGHGTMIELTFEEKNLVCIYSGSGTRQETISALTDMRRYLEPDETELLALTDSALGKLRRMDDEQFAALDLIPDFDPEDSAYGE